MSALTRLFRLLLAPALAVAGTACYPEYYRQRLPLIESLAWLHEGTTERSEVLQRLGPPASGFENERIQVWAVINEKEEAWYFDRDAEYDLVIVFDESQRVVRASLVRLE